MAQTMKVAPIIIVVDVSGSMAGAPMDAVEQIIPDISRIGAEDPLKDEMTQVGLIEFDSAARVLIPIVEGGKLSELEDYPYKFANPTCPTRYAPAFRAVRNELAAFHSRFRNRYKGIEPDIMRPTVFFISDGEPVGEDESERQAAWHELIANSDCGTPRVIPVAVGKNANVEVLNQYVNKFRHAIVGDSNDAAKGIRNALELIGRTINSYADSYAAYDINDRDLDKLLDSSRPDASPLLS